MLTKKAKNNLTLLPTSKKKPTYEALEKKIKKQTNLIAELETQAKTVKQLCAIQGVKIRELTKKTEILDRYKEAIIKATIYYSKRKPLKWWQKFF